MLSNALKIIGHRSRKLSGARIAVMANQLKTEPGMIASNATTMTCGWMEVLISRIGSALTGNGGKRMKTVFDVIERIEEAKNISSEIFRMALDEENQEVHDRLMSASALIDDYVVLLKQVKVKK